jgi:hypothetical protein
MSAHGPFSVALRDVARARRDALAVFIEPDGSQVLQAEFADKRLRQYHVRDFVVRLCR